MKAELIDYDPSRSKLDAGTVQNAIDTLADRAVLASPTTLKNVDLSEMFEEGIYLFSDTCTNGPRQMANYKYTEGSTTTIEPVKVNGRLIIFHNTDKHITQVVLPNNDPEDIYLRHWSKVSGGTYQWSDWYSTTLNTYRWIAPALEWNAAVHARGYVRYRGKLINAANFPSSVFEITGTLTTGQYTKWIVYVGSSEIGNMYKVLSVSDTAYIAMDVTGAGNLVAKLVHTASQPTSKPDVYLQVVKLR